MSTTFETSNECFLQHKFTYFCHRYLLLVISDSTCTYVSYLSHIKHTYNSLEQLKIIYFFDAYVRDKDCTNYQHAPLCSEVYTFQMLHLTFKGSKVCSNPVYLFML